MFSATATVVAADGAEHVPLPLVVATRNRFAADVRQVDGISIEIDTTIPRSVGLAGSSAIVIAALRALDEYTSAGLTDMDVAELAHTIERVDLGIAGGWQDQLIQSHGFSALVECAEPRRVEAIDMATNPPIPMYLAWSEAAAESSGEAHTGLRSARSPQDPEMRQLAELGRQAAASFANRDVHTLKDAINSTFDIRRSIMHIAPAQLEMIVTAQALGASANFAGSGGAIVGVLPKEGQPLLDGLAAAGYGVIHWDAQ